MDGECGHNAFSNYSRRLNILIAAFVGWALVIIVALYQVMVSRREHYIAQYQESSWRIGTLPALRGRILDGRGLPLAWSMRYFTLYYDVPADQEIVNRDLRSLHQALQLEISPNRLDQPGTIVPLKANLSTEEVVKLDAVVRDNPRYFVKSRFSRQLLNGSTNATGTLGRIAIVDDREVGISGLEKKYDTRLRGVDGKYRVMVDRYDNWVPETWEELQAPIPGYDVYASYSPN